MTDLSLEAQRTLDAFLDDVALARGLANNTIAAYRHDLTGFDIRFGQ